MARSTKAPVGLATIRELALGLAGTAEGPCYGTPGFRVKKSLYCRVLDDDRIVVRMSLDQRDVAARRHPARSVGRTRWARGCDPAIEDAARETSTQTVTRS